MFGQIADAFRSVELKVHHIAEGIEIIPFLFDIQVPDLRFSDVFSGINLAQRPRDTAPTLVQHMGVNLGGLDVAVAEQFLDSTEVIAVFE